MQEAGNRYISRKRYVEEEIAMFLFTPKTVMSPIIERLEERTSESLMVS